jgi:hypothetical protein
VISKRLWSIVLILSCSFLLCPSAKAQAPSLGAGGSPIGGVTTADVVGALVGAAAVVVVVVIVAVHYSKKRTITGCVTSGANGMSLTDEKNKQIYALSSNTEGIKPGDRMKLHGKRVKSKGSENKLVWETKSVAMDYGVCPQP